MEHEVADVLWRALGFPDVAPTSPHTPDEDVRALAIAAAGLIRLQGDRREAALEAIVREARMVSAHLTRVAEIEADAMAEMRPLGLRERCSTRRSSEASSTPTWAGCCYTGCAAAWTKRSVAA